MNHTPPCSYFNEMARPGFGKALSKAYCDWSESNPDHSREAGKAKYVELADSLAKKFPTWKEIENSP